MDETEAVVFDFDGVIAKPIGKDTLLTPGSIAKIELYAGIEEVIDYIIKKYKIGIITQNKHGTVWQILREKKLPFNIQIVGDENSELAEKRLNYIIGVRLRVQPSETVYIGDRVPDIQAGVDNKVKRVIVAAYGDGIRDNLERMMSKFNADRNITTRIEMVESPKEILNYLN
ncbi:HAD hydrolase-like protein [Candidatus Woesearchaeota archaeon]|nr:HAD hydrolase-like protein [Candidatus Woesearchaeota archaeon]